MSVVPYNPNNKIVYHDPTHGILVLHNNQQNTFQLLSTSHTASEGNRYSSHSNVHNNTCPNCGFAWDYQNYRKDQYPRRPSAGDSQQLSEPDGATGTSQPLSNGLPVDFRSNSGDGFMHHDYFKLLENLPHHVKFKLGSALQNDTCLPENIFNQGYFQRFFKKVPPFTLGTGAHAQVYKVIHVLNEIRLGTYAVKRICIGDKVEFLEQVLNEVMILYELSVQGANENNLIRYNHVWLEMGDLDDSSTFIIPDYNGRTSGSSRNDKVPYVFILQQYCDGGHLEDLIYDNFLPEKRQSMKERVDIEREKRRRRSRSRSKVDRDLFQDEELPFHREWLDDIEIWKFIKDVVNGVHYLHLHGILHRDLKPSNCLLDEKYKYFPTNKIWDDDDFELYIQNLPKVLVSDFGEGKYINKHKQFTEDSEFNMSTSINNMHSTERCGNTGTLEFTAPELWLYSNYERPDLEGLQSQKFTNEFTYESDIYSLGLILCWLCVGSLPFSNLIENEVDPLVIRSKILDWYFVLDQNSFNDWFNEALGTRTKTRTLNEFRNLIYLMIKGSDSEPISRVLTGKIISMLNEMKKNFIYQDQEKQERKKKGKQPIKTTSNKISPKVLNISIYGGYFFSYLVSEYIVIRNFWLSIFLKLLIFGNIGYDLFWVPKMTQRGAIMMAMLSVCIGSAILG
ncbi:hypothetical protein CAAN1_11S03994 [[Candida] anglica]|uniref:Protein kinase domain-containing protein n=1 Tax=[Candida] anglica TaxID=148631 RepID=A0ABP0EHW5_9ASCO